MTFESPSTPPADASQGRGGTAAFHPAVRDWFDATFAAPTEPQDRAWPQIRAGRDTLVAAPTGSGKTLTAFLSAIDELVHLGLDGELRDETYVIYVSPLKALGNDVERNLREPLAGIRHQLVALGLPDVEIRTAVRSGDTPARERRGMIERPPHIFVTTPESLYILLTTKGGRGMLRTARTVIVDEIHALVGNKRGSHLALTLARLDALTDTRPARIGLSATQRPIETVARFLGGTGTSPVPDTGPRAVDDSAPSGAPVQGRHGGECVVVDTGHVRSLDLAIEIPDSPLSAVMSAEVWTELHVRLVSLIEAHRTTLIFVNTRRLAERLSADLSEHLGDDAVTSHHGSLSRAHRLQAEQRLKCGELKALVATASLELGIDIGEVDLVCQMGSTRSIATFLQRVGRAGHQVGAVSKGRVFPLSRDELVECVAILDAVDRAELDHVTVPEGPLDILAQQIVAATVCEAFDSDELYALVRSAWPFRDLARADFDEVVTMLARGFTTRRGRRGAYLHHDAVNGRIRARRNARLTAIMCGGAIPETADYDVVLEPAGQRIGSVNEDFAVESVAGDIFQLGNASWQIVRVEPGKVRVQDAAGLPPTLPFWLGEAPARSNELSAAVSRLRSTIDQALGAGVDGAVDALTDVPGVSEPAARQTVEYLAAARNALGAMPTQECVVLERFFDEAGGMQLVVHAPFGARLNRGWGLALRKRFCRKFNFELQAAATEDAIVLSLGPTHSFPLDEVFDYLGPDTVREVLVQAVLVAPMFATRWRWNANRALAVPRMRSGKKVPAVLQRMQADDLVAVVFPDQLACFENIQGEREVPDHPFVRQTLRDCLEEAMDIEALEALVGSLRDRTLRTHAADLTEPSPLAAEILTARPYAFLDDAPLEERRTAAVRGRRWIDPDDARSLGSLDADQIDRAVRIAWPTVRDAEELHDALCVAGSLAPDVDSVLADPDDSDRPGVEPKVAEAWEGCFAVLVAAGRAYEAIGAAGTRMWVAAERAAEVRAAVPQVRFRPDLDLPPALDLAVEPATAARELVRGRMEIAGPTTFDEIVERVPIGLAAVRDAMLALENEGFVMRGRYRPDADADVEEWCERRLLARIHRGTLERLRAAVRPVSAAALARFLARWQGVGPEVSPEGPEALFAVITALAGFSAPAVAWEQHILPARMPAYDPAWLDTLCLSGRVVWMRPPWRGSGGAGPVRTSPICVLPREQVDVWFGRGRPTEVLARDASREPRRRGVGRAGCALFR